MCSWFRLARSISGVNTMGVPLAELSLYNTYRTQAQCPRGDSQCTEDIHREHTHRTAFRDVDLNCWRSLFKNPRVHTKPCVENTQTASVLVLN